MKKNILQWNNLRIVADLSACMGEFIRPKCNRQFLIGGKKGVRKNE